MQATKRMCVMVVDDNKGDLFFFKKAVETIDSSYECIQASNGADAIQQLTTLSPLPDCIFLDRHMPVMDGLDTLIEIKKTERLREMPIIVFSGSSDEKDIARVKSMGADFHFFKPADVEDLIHEISHVLRTISGSQASL